MSKNQRIEIGRRESLKGVEGYEAFMRDLEEAYNLSAMPVEGLRWAGVKPSSISSFPPRIEIEPVKGAPKLEVRVHALRDGVDIAPGIEYTAPLMLRDVETWESSNLRNYKIARVRGKKEGAERLDDSTTLKEILRKIDQEVGGKTPVVHAVAFLPQSNDRSYVTEFVPEIIFDPNTSTIMPQQ